MTKPLIVHLIDDTTPGGVMRVLDHIANTPAMAENGRHMVRVVPRSALSFKRIEADMIVSHLTITWRGLPGLVALRAIHAGLPLLHVEHSYTEGFVASEVRNRRRFNTLLRTAYALFDRVIAVSSAQGRWLQTRGLVDAASIYVIPSAIDIGPFLALDLTSRGTPCRLGAIGRLDKQKGFDTLIAAFAALPDLDMQLDIYGEGADREALEALAAGNDRIILHGHVDPVEAMTDIDVLVMPSRWEAYGLVALEARAAGRPVMVSGVDGLADHVDRGATSVSGASVQAWKLALADIVTRTEPASAAQDRRQSAAAEAAGFAIAWTSLIAELLPTAQSPSDGLASDAPLAV
jgi:glycosyltransferase involved in cell wall biosynthesis